MGFRDFILNESVLDDNTKKKVISKKHDEYELNEKVKRFVNLPEDILRNNGIKIKSSDMDDESYVILLFDKKDVEIAKEALENEDYKVTNVNKLLYVS